MNKETELAYAEVDAILDLMEPEAIEKIPLKVREFFKREKDKKCVFFVDRDLLENGNIELRKETICLLTILEINYWCENEEEKQLIINKLKETDKINEERLREIYNPDNIFKNRNNFNTDINKECVSFIEYKEQGSIKKILEKILKLFKKKIRGAK